MVRRGEERTMTEPTGARGALISLGCWLNDLAQSVPDGLLKLLLRLGIASVFFKSGLVKLASWQSTVMLFEMEYRVPVFGPETAGGAAGARAASPSTISFGPDSCAASAAEPGLEAADTPATLVSPSCPAISLGDA